MDPKRIKVLLEKYYKGKTSLEEEKTLSEYFRREDVAPEFISDRDIFMYQVQETENLKSVPDISNEIWESLNSFEEYKLKKNKKLAYIFLRIAAGVLILIGSYYILGDQVLNTDQNVVMKDTFNEPEMAYEQAKETLLYVSALLNNGTDQLEPIHKINEGTQKLKSLSRLNDGIKELEPIKKYTKADKYFKQ